MTIAYEHDVRQEILIVFLPGIGDFAEDFESGGFIDLLLQSGMKADAIAADAHYGYYARRSLHERLARDVVLPARSRGYREIWLVGISMGGIGALSYLAHHPGHISRALLLAPYLGESEWIREITDGDVSASPRDDARAHIQQLWHWIREQHGDHQALRPKLFLGYGTNDRFAGANAMFARHLPERHVLSIPGGHDWPTWKRLWQTFLAAWNEELRTSAPLRA